MRVYIILLVSIFTVEWGYAGYHNLVLHAPFPYNTPLFDPGVRFSDWTNFLPRVSHYGEPGMQVRTDLGYPYPYPLPTLYIFLLFLRLFSDTLTAYIVFTVIAFTLSTLIFWVYLHRRTSAGRSVLFAVWITFLLGSPAEFLLDRGNIEVFLWLFVLIGLVAFVYDWKYVAAIFFALAACMKIYPALYLLLFLPRRQFKAAALGAILTAAFSVLALRAVGPSTHVAYHNMSDAALFLQTRQIVALNEPSLRFDHSLLAIWKQAFDVVLVYRNPLYIQYPPAFVRSASIYSVVAPLIFAVVYLFRLRRMPLLNQFIALTIFSVILPYVSYDYTLVHIYLVFAVFLLFLVKDGSTAPIAQGGSSLLVAMACFAIIFSPLAFLTLEVYQGQVKGLALVGLLTIALLCPMPSKLFQDPSSELQIASGR